MVAHLRPRDCMTSLQSGSCARESVTRAIIRLHKCTHADINTRRLICLHNFGSCSLCYSSASRRSLAVVVRECTSQCCLYTHSTLNLGAALLSIQPYCSVTPTSHTHIHTHARTHARHPSILAAIKSGAQKSR